MSEREVMTAQEAKQVYDSQDTWHEVKLLNVAKEYHRRMVEAEKRETISAEEQIRQAKESYGPNWIDHLLLAVIKANPILSHYVPKPKMSDKERIEKAINYLRTASQEWRGAADRGIRILRGESE